MFLLRSASSPMLLAMLAFVQCTIADGEDLDQPALFAHPSGGEVYLETADIIITGTSDGPGGLFTAELYDQRNVICQSAGADGTAQRSQGQWAIRLTQIRGAWKAGNYRIKTVVVTDATFSLVPVTIIADERHRAAGRIPRAPEAPDHEKNPPPLLSFPKCSIIDSSVDKVKFKPADPNLQRPDKPKTASLTAGERYTLAGIIDVQEKSEIPAAPVVLQIVERRKSENGENLTVIVNEDFVEPEPTKTGFQFKRTLTCPQVEGRYLLRALYRRTKIGEMPVEVKLDDASK